MTDPSRGPRLPRDVWLAFWVAVGVVLVLAVIRGYRSGWRGGPFGRSPGPRGGPTRPPRPRGRIVAPIDGRYVEAHQWFAVDVPSDFSPSVDLDAPPDRVAQHCYDLLRRIPLSSGRASVHQLFHALHAFGPEFAVVNDAIGRPQSVLDCLRGYYGGSGDGVVGHTGLPAWIIVTDQGAVFPVGEIALVQQEHPDQFLAILAQAGVERHTVLTTKCGREASLADVLETSIRNHNPTAEPAWTAIAIATWGESFTYNRRRGNYFELSHLIYRCLNFPPQRPPIWVLRRLIAATVVRHRIRRDFADWVTPEQLQAVERTLQIHLARLRATQFPDGAVSREWAANQSAYPRTNGELIEFNGLALQWLTLYLDGPELRQPAVGRCAVRLCRALCEELSDSAGAQLTIDYAGLCRAAHGLKQYRAKTTLEPSHPASDRAEEEGK